MNPEELRKACDVAIAALEKQVPKTPDFQGDGYADGELVIDTWICPNCGQYYEVDYDDYKYCPNCGQAIDWDESKELSTEETETINEAFDIIKKALISEEKKR